MKIVTIQPALIKMELVITCKNIMEVVACKILRSMIFTPLKFIRYFSYFHCQLYIFPTSSPCQGYGKTVMAVGQWISINGSVHLIQLSCTHVLLKERQKYLSSLVGTVSKKETWGLYFACSLDKDCIPKLIVMPKGSMHRCVEAIH